MEGRWGPKFSTLRQLFQILLTLKHLRERPHEQQCLLANFSTPYLDHNPMTDTLVYLPAVDMTDSQRSLVSCSQVTERMHMWWTRDWKAVRLLPDGVLFTTTTLLIRTLALPEPGWHTENLQVLAAKHWTLKYTPPPAKSSRNSPNYLGGGEGRRSSTMPYFGIMKLEDHVFFHLFSVQTFDRRKVASHPHPIINNDPILPSRTTGWWKEARERSSFTKCCSQKSIKFTYEFFLILFN